VADKKSPAIEAITAMSPEQREAALLRILRLMCSDDEGNWDEAEAERLRRACAKAERDGER